MKREKEALKDDFQKDEASDKSEWMKNHPPTTWVLELTIEQSGPWRHEKSSVENCNERRRSGEHEINSFAHSYTHFDI